MRFENRWKFASTGLSSRIERLVCAVCPCFDKVKTVGENKKTLKVFLLNSCPGHRNNVRVSSLLEARFRKTLPQKTAQINSLVFKGKLRRRGAKLPIAKPFFAAFL